MLSLFFFFFLLRMHFFPSAFLLRDRERMVLLSVSHRIAQEMYLMVNCVMIYLF